MQTLRAYNSRFLKNKVAKFSGYYFCMKTNIKGNFQICISVPLIEFGATGSGIQQLNHWAIESLIQFITGFKTCFVVLADLSMNGMWSCLHAPTRTSIYLGVLLSCVQNFIWQVNYMPTLLQVRSFILLQIIHLQLHEWKWALQFLVTLIVDIFI